MVAATTATPTPTTPFRDEPFKVIIVGAGVGGLTLAHCLHRADVDFVVLDKHPVAPAWGGSISIHPSSSRVLDQLGILDALDDICTPMHDFWNRDASGQNYLSGPFFDQIKSRTGYLTYTLERRKFLQTLYDTLPNAKSRVIENARLVEITTIPASSSSSTSSSKIQALLSDGTSHTGDLIIGCDGVHSTVRSLLWSQAHLLSPGFITVSEKQSIKTTYNCLVGVAPMQPGLGSRDMTSVSGRKTGAPFSLLFLTQPDAIFFIIHCKLPDDQVVQYPNRARYTDADAEAKVAELADCPVGETLTFGDIWKSRTRGHLVSLEEGVLSHWFFQRMVLLGDSAHKVTPNAAFGGNLAIEDAVVLANEIVGMVRRHPNKKPSDREVEIALERYQRERLPRVKEIFNVSWALTRLQAYDGWGFWIVQRVALPILGLDLVAAQVAKACSEAPKLRYIPFVEKTGTLPWKVHEPHPEEPRKAQMVNGLPGAEKADASHGLVVPVVLFTLLVYVAVVWGFATKFAYFLFQVMGSL